LAFVNNEPNPQKVPPPVAVPPILSYESSDSTYNENNKHNCAWKYPHNIYTHTHTYILMYACNSTTIPRCSENILKVRSACLKRTDNILLQFPN